MLLFENLNIYNGDKQLVKNLTLEIHRGEVISLVGESGSGKSLTCLSVLNLLPEQLQTQGSILYTHKNGKLEQLMHMSAKQRQTFALKKIAYVFQEPLSALNPVQTCGEQLLENIEICGIRSPKEAILRAKVLLQKVELNDFDRVFNSFPFQLSGGQRQRVMIAMAMAGDPELIIADEPTTALDVLLQDEILGLLRNLCLQDGRSMLLVSHDMDAVSKFSDRVAVMYKGELVEVGACAKIMEAPEHVYTKALLACKPKVENKGFYLQTLGDAMADALTPPKKFDEEPKNEALVVKLSNLKKEYREGQKVFQAIQQLSFEMKKGSSTALIGESGSGKSTISKLLVKLEHLSGGHIDYFFENNKPLSSNVQMIFQDPFSALNPALNVGDMLLEVLKKHQSELSAAQHLEQIKDLLLKVGLPIESINKYPNEFSGGQRQRLCIARALAAKPELLICDESTSALDLSVQAQILNLLKELQIKESLSILMVTHSMAVAAWFCQYLVVLKNGEIVEQGTCEALIQNPQHEYTKAMIAHI